MPAPRKSLIVGASGQVGHQLVLALGPDKVVCASRIPRPGWVHIDLADLRDKPHIAKRVIQDFNIDAVYCVGGATDVERCESDSDWAMKTNHLGPATLASLSEKVPFVYFSTEYVFDGRQGPYAESSPKNPICVYGWSKSLGEESILRAHPSPLIVRTTVVYGEDPGGKNFLYTLRRNLSAGTGMRVPIDQISTPTYNRDLAKASIQLVQGSHQGIFNICGQELLSRYDFAIRSAQLMQLDSSKIVGVSTSSLNQRAPRPLNAGLLTDKLVQTLPEFVMRGMDAGIQDWITSLNRHTD